ncbi:MAG: type II toxin-antitoxin system Phd/YefM family antitoxin [Candidatus Baltobacteraceae bacterium]
MKIVKTVNMHEAKTHLSRLVNELKSGTEYEVIIAVGNKPTARLTAFEAPVRSLGLDRGLFEVPDDFDAPSADIEAMFHGKVQ